MFLSNPAKILYATSFLSLFLAGCGSWRQNENSAATLASPVKNSIPFSTREPEVFRAELVLRGGSDERKISIARNGENRRIDYDPDTDRHRAVLTSGKQYLIFFKRRAYTERELSSGALPDSELGSELLNLRDYTRFEEIGRDGDIVRFRAEINESPASEVLIFFDETIGLPTKQEFYSIDGTARELRYSVELRDFKRDVDPALFQLPAGFRRER